MITLKQPLRAILTKYYHVECYDPQLIKSAIISGKGLPYDAELFKAQLREAIDGSLISPATYEELTEEDFDSLEDLQVWLEEVYSELP